MRDIYLTVQRLDSRLKGPHLVRFFLLCYPMAEDRSAKEHAQVKAREDKTHFYNKPTLDNDINPFMRAEST
jgi:hypothetical protein